MGLTAAPAQFPMLWKAMRVGWTNGINNALNGLMEKEKQAGSERGTGGGRQRKRNRSKGGVRERGRECGL